MAFSLSQKLKIQKSFVIDILLQIMITLFIGVVFCYLMLFLKTYLQSQRVSAIENLTASLNTNHQKIVEEKVLGYQQKVNEFSSLISKQKLSSHIFSFIEEHTLSEVWFSSFDMTESNSKISLLGEAENMEAFSRQIQTFEKSNAITKVAVLNSENLSSGIRFSIELYFAPDIFSYMPMATNQ